jgi:tetratricopeptide (TPR) repeat protein
VPPYRELLRELASLLAEGALPIEQRVWALSQQAMIRHRLGRDDETVTQLLREMPSLVGAGEGGLASLHLALSRAYLGIGAAREAGVEAGRMLSSSSQVDPDDRAEAMLLLGEAKLATASNEDEVREVRGLLHGIVEGESSTPSYLPAMLRLAEVEAELGAEAEARSWYRRLVREWSALPRKPEGLGDDVIVGSLLERFEERLQRGEPEASLVYAALSGEMFESLEATPAIVLEALAVGHRARAMEILGIEESGERLPEFAWGLLEAGGADESSQLDAKRNLIRSASYFRAHADRFIIDDIEVYADSLWQSAMLFDRAGDKPSAISALGEFVEARPNDPRRPEARFRLGQAYQSMGQYGTAAGFYEGLADERQAGGIVRVGDWAERSLVPLAQSYVDRKSVV